MCKTILRASVRGLFFCSYISEPSLGRVLFEQWGGLLPPLLLLHLLLLRKISGRTLEYEVDSEPFSVTFFSASRSDPLSSPSCFQACLGAGGCTSSHHQLLTSPHFNSQIKKSPLSLPHRSLNTIYMAHLTTSLLHSSTQVAFVQSLFKLIPLFLMSSLVTMFSAPVPGWARPEAECYYHSKSF